MRNTDIKKSRVTNTSARKDIGFLSEEDLMSWIGSITCEATAGALEPARSQAVKLTLWDTVTIRITTNCVTCQLQGVVEASKIILTQVNLSGG